MKEECWETQPCLLTELPSSVPGLRGGLQPLPASPCAGWLGALGTASGTARLPPPKFSVVSSLPVLDSAVSGESNRLAAPARGAERAVAGSSAAVPVPRSGLAKSQRLTVPPQYPWAPQRCPPCPGPRAKPGWQQMPALFSRLSGWLLTAPAPALGKEPPHRSALNIC